MYLAANYEGSPPPPPHTFSIWGNYANVVNSFVVGWSYNSSSLCLQQHFKQQFCLFFLFELNKILKNKKGHYIFCRLVKWHYLKIKSDEIVWVGLLWDKTVDYNYPNCRNKSIRTIRIFLRHFQTSMYIK